MKKTIMFLFNFLFVLFIFGCSEKNTVSPVSPSPSSINQLSNTAPVTCIIPGNVPGLKIFITNPMKNPRLEEFQNKFSNGSGSTANSGNIKGAKSITNTPILDWDSYIWLDGTKLHLDTWSAANHVMDLISAEETAVGDGQSLGGISTTGYSTNSVEAAGWIQLQQSYSKLEGIGSHHWVLQSHGYDHYEASYHSIP